MQIEKCAVFMPYSYYQPTQQPATRKSKLKTLAKQIPLPFTVLALLIFTSPIHLAAAQPTISMVDVKTFDPQTFRFPGGQAFNYRPGIVTVSQGGTVQFVDRGFEPHTVTSYTIKMDLPFEGVIISIPIPDGTFDSGIATPIESGETWTLDTGSLAPGDYKYFCQFHPWMQAALRVVSDPSSKTATVNMDHAIGKNNDQFFSGSASWGFLPRQLQSKAGSSVAVTNKGIVPHTFTSYTMKIPVVVGGHTLMIPVPDGTFDSGTVLASGSYTLTTSGLSPGTYKYFCAIHPWMQASLTLS